MSEPFVGQITVFPYSFAPKGWMNCTGQLLPIAQYTALFSLLGTYYGGDGRVTFALPDLRGRVAINNGQLPGGSDYVIGEVGGLESVTIDSQTLPQHTHSMSATQVQGTVNTPAGNVLASVVQGDFTGSNQGFVYNPGAPNTALEPASIGVAGSQFPHNNIQPSLVLRYCIAVEGIYPSRG